ncbi:MAG: hypothetical protein RLZZ42_10 [Bacteroidota bacterium]|jgi:hypothetical protein
MSFSVLIACYSNWDACSEVPFMLKQGGCKVDIFCSGKSWLRSSSYYDNWIESPVALDAYRNALITLVEKNKFDWVILADDGLIGYMNEVVSAEQFPKIMPIQDVSQRKMLSSKKGFSEFCRENGIDTPGFVIYNKKEDIEIIRNTLTFPVINKLDFSWGGTDMFISNTPEELEANLHKIPENQNVLIQEYIEGEEIHVEALFYGGELMAYFSSNILQYSTTKFSYTTKKLYYENLEIAPVLRKVGKALTMNSFGNICFLYDARRSTYFLIEVDPRPNSWMPYSRFIGQHHFIKAVENIVNGNIKNSFSKMGLLREKTEVALFYKDIRRTLWQKDIKSFTKWTLNISGYWRFIPTYDRRLMKRILKEVWNEVFMFYIRKWTGRKK